MSENEIRTLFRRLEVFAFDLNRDRYMLLEYLGPLIDGCRAALNVSLEKAQALHTLTENDIDTFLETTSPSFLSLTICFQITDTDEACSIVFDAGHISSFDECIEPDVVVAGPEKLLMALFDADANVSPIDELGVSYQIAGNEPSDILEALGMLCYTPLLRVARSGIDPASLLSENADSIILATASDLVNKMVQRWVDVQAVK
ncbi:MAG: hypothetical protein P1Q69_13700 [Candidatus Thorarchaeota archaeon]|nr:hypothetical protein [Candidatus Thorarchaeota archaeon]